MYLVLNITEWREVSAVLWNQEISVNIPNSGIGYCPVYKTKEEAIKDYPNCTLLEITEKPLEK